MVASNPSLNTIAGGAPKLLITADVDEPLTFTGTGAAVQPLAPIPVTEYAAFIGVVAITVDPTVVFNPVAGVQV